MSATIRVTGKVRELLLELDELFRRFDAATEVLANRNTGPSLAADIGAERESIRAQITGCALRINKASRGESS